MGLVSFGGAFDSIDGVPNLPWQQLRPLSEVASVFLGARRSSLAVTAVSMGGGLNVPWRNLWSPSDAASVYLDGGVIIPCPRFWPP